MKKTIITTILIFFSFTQSYCQGLKLLSDIEDIEYQYKGKQTLVFIVMPWCSSSCEDAKSITTTIINNREKLNLILIVDSVYFQNKSKSYNKLIDDLHPNKLVAVNAYYKKGLSTKKECRDLGKVFSEKYNQEDDSMIGPGAMWFSNCNRQLIDIYTIYNHGLNKFKDEIQQLTPCP